MIIRLLKNGFGWYGVLCVCADIFYSKEFARLIKEAGSGKWRIATDIID